MKKFADFIEIVKRLRKECPWDREQTLESLKPYLVEEVYEAIQAIDDNDYDKLADEVGDMLLHVVMLSVFAEEDQYFDINKVIDNISAKMIRRHPHVFAQGDAKTKEQVWEKWEKIKKAEAQAQAKNKGKEEGKGLLKNIPKSMPALYRADRIQKRVSRVGFDWDNVAGAWDKVHEELEEVHDLLKSKVQGPKLKVKEEIGDLLFAITNVARKLDINAEEALQQANNKFIRRFGQIEKHLEKEKLTLKQMDELWQQAKEQEQVQGR